MNIGIIGTKSYLSKILQQNLSLYCNVILYESSTFRFSSTLVGLQNIFSPQLDVIIFLSWLTKPRDKLCADENINLVRNVIKAINQNKTKLIFISSMSAYENSKSIYGRSKFEAEKIVLEHGHNVVRVGSVFNSNLVDTLGMMEFFVKIMKRTPTFIYFDPDIKIPQISPESFFLKLFSIIKNLDLVTGVQYTIFDNYFSVNNFLNSPYKKIRIKIPLFIIDVILKVFSKFSLRFIDYYDSWLGLSYQSNRN